MEHTPSKLIARFAVAGMSNRRALLEELEHRLATGEQLVVALADLNGFKHYNDTYGHPAGDALLRRLAARLVDACPAGTTAARLGGDEFCVLAPATVDDEELRTRVSSALSEQGEGFSISAACGTAHVRRAAELHDIGKVAIPASILTKPGSLTAEEWDFIRRHTVTSRSSWCRDSPFRVKLCLEPGELLGRERELGGGERVLEVGARGRADRRPARSSGWAST